MVDKLEENAHIKKNRSRPRIEAAQNVQK